MPDVERGISGATITTFGDALWWAVVRITTVSFAIVGQQGLASLGTFNQQENNLERAFSDAAAYVQTIVSPEETQAVVDSAFRIAITRLQPTVIVLPHDVQGMAAVDPTPAHWVSWSSSGAPSTAILPSAQEPESSPRCAEKTSCRPMFRTTRSNSDCSDRCDTLVLIGTNYPYGEFLPETGHARAIQIDLKPEQLGLRYPTEVNLWGDAKATLVALLLRGRKGWLWGTSTKSPPVSTMRCQGERLVYRAGREAGVRLLGLSPGDTVLDLGCGTGLNFGRLADAVGPGGTVIGLDRSPAMLRMARRRVDSNGWRTVRLVEADATRFDPRRSRACCRRHGSPLVRVGVRGC